MKYSPYSFSKLSLHEQCNRKFKYRYLDKVKPAKRDMTALLKGGAVHSILENYPEKSKHKLAPKYQYIVDGFIKTDLGKKYIQENQERIVPEYSFGLTKDFEPTTYKSKDAVFRGFIDYISIIENTLNILDWKTGKYKEPKWQTYEQLLFYAIYFFKKYKQIHKIRISYVYVEQDSENDLILERKYLENYESNLRNMIYSAESDKEFKKCPSKLCEYCEFKTHCDADVS